MWRERDLGVGFCFEKQIFRHKSIVTGYMGTVTFRGKYFRKEPMNYRNVKKLTKSDFEKVKEWIFSVFFPRRCPLCD